MLHPQSGSIGEKAFQKVQIPHKIGMFVRHQKATAPWPCSIWPNMERKNAAFSRNQTGKKEKKKGRFSCTLCAQWDRALTLTTQWPQSWLPLKTAWLMVMLDLPWHLSEHCWAHTHTHARLRSHEREAHRSFHYADISFLNTHKSFLHFHIWALYWSLSSALRIGAPWKGTFLLVKKQPSQTPQSSALVRNGLFIWPPPRYTERLWHSPATAALQKMSMWVCHFTRNLSNYLGHFLERVWIAGNGGKLLGDEKQKSELSSTEQSNKYRDLTVGYSSFTEPA